MERQESKEAAVKCSYRITQEGLQCILPFMTKQILRPSIETFLKLLKVPPPLPPFLAVLIR